MATLDTSEHSKKCHVWMIQVVHINCIFLTWRMTKSAKSCHIVDWLTSVKTIQKVSDILPASWRCTAPLFVHASIRDSAKLCHFLETHAKIKVCVKLGMMPKQTNVEMTAAHMNYKVNKKLIFKWQGCLQEGRESLNDDSTPLKWDDIIWLNL